MAERFVLLFLPPHDEQTRGWAARLEAAATPADIVIAETDDEARAVIRRADAALGWIPPETLADARRLRWLQVPQINPPASYFYPALVAHPCVATNFRGIFNDHIATHILAFVLAFARGFHYYLPRQFRHEYRPEPLDTGVVHLPGSTALIVGVGGIGLETADRLACLGMSVTGVDPRLTERPASLLALHPSAALDELLPEADFVIVTVPETPETEGMFDLARFRRMKPTGFFVNIGRGSTTRLNDLDRALREGLIAGAALDVFEVEPLPDDHPLWAAPNLLMTPHTSGYGPDLEDRRVALLVDNARRFASGAPLRNVVDKALWY